MLLEFTKMNGAGNDFVLVDNRDGSVQLSTAQIRRLCDRNRGIGADGILLVEPSDAGVDFRMRYFNRDGGEVEMCGNGARCFARFAGGFAGKKALAFETPAGPIKAQVHEDRVELDMGDPLDLSLHQKLEIAGQLLEVHSVNTGVPHACVIVDDVEHVPLQEWGAAIRYHDHFSPKGTNANFLQLTGPQELVVRTYERGVEGETLACGTGVTAAAIIYHELKGATAPIRVKVRGGDVLTVNFDELSGVYRNVTLTGPAERVFEGRIEIG